VRTRVRGLQSHRKAGGGPSRHANRRQRRRWRLSACGGQVLRPLARSPTRAIDAQLRLIRDAAAQAQRRSHVPHPAPRGRWPGWRCSTATALTRRSGWGRCGCRTKLRSRGRPVHPENSFAEHDRRRWHGHRSAPAASASTKSVIQQLEVLAQARRRDRHGAPAGARAVRRRGLTQRAGLASQEVRGAPPD
jgi:hypothetical protein